MDPDKAPGPDGFNPECYQKMWNIIGDDVVKDCKEWLHHIHIPTPVQATTIILLPRVSDPKTMKDLRPISLCSVY
ncbi:hypothetical protein LINGRAHAP2_LOCUS22801 [Linum grandiflorum]